MSHSKLFIKNSQISKASGRKEGGNHEMQSNLNAKTQGVSEDQEPSAKRGFTSLQNINPMITVVYSCIQ